MVIGGGLQPKGEDKSHKGQSWEVRQVTGGGGGHSRSQSARCVRSTRGAHEFTRGISLAPETLCCVDQVRLRAIIRCVPDKTWWKPPPATHKPPAKKIKKPTKALAKRTKEEERGGRMRESKLPPSSREALGLGKQREFRERVVMSCGPFFRHTSRFIHQKLAH